MNVLSLFDGMSCGQLALSRLGVKVDKYYASEIDKYAIKIAQKNFPKTIQIGDVVNVKGSDLDSIDLILCGSPCQGFSFAGKQLNFNDPRSSLFFEFVRLLKEIKPKYFLLENVKMKKEYQDVITEVLKVEPIEINSSLISAQNRKRLYWTNITGINQPNDKKIYLRDILLTSEKPTTYKGVDGLDFIFGIEKGRRLHDGKDLSRNFRDGYRVYSDNGKAATLTSSSKGCPGGFSGLYHTQKAIDYMNREVKGGRNHWDFKHHSNSKNEKSATLVANLYKGVPYNVLKEEVLVHNIYGGFKEKKCRVFKDKSPTLRANSGGGSLPSVFNGTEKEAKELEFVIRKLHPVECERLQTLPDNYTEGVSNTQRYKMIGNGWTVDVISHILKGIIK